MKKRQTDHTTAQRCPSPAERGHSGRGEPFTLELSGNTERASPVTEKKEPAFFAGTWVVPRKHYAFVP